MKPSATKAAPRFRLTRNFAIVAGVVLLLVTVALSLLYRSWAIGQLRTEVEQSNVNVARLLANVLWEHQRPLLQSLTEADPGDLRDRPEIEPLAAVIGNLVRGAPVVKVKIYSLAGTTIFSTARSQIGEDKLQDEGVASALGGVVASELAHANTLSTFEGAIVDRDLLSSYVPIYRTDKSHDVAGVFEVYNDVTGFVGEINRVQIWLAVIGLGSAVLVYAALVAVVRHGDRLLLRQHQETVALTRSISRAEAASQAKSHFLAGMSHELRTPLNAVIGFAELIQGQTFGPINARYTDYVGEISNSGRALLGMIDSILDLAKLELGSVELKLADIDPGELVRESAAALRDRAKKAGVQLVVEAEPDLPLLTADIGKLRQALGHLLSNAVKFSHSGGDVRLSVGRADGGYCRFVIADHGIGMRPEDIPLAMAPFSQVDGTLARRYEGAGLGLSLATRFVELMGGSLTIDSAPNRGTTVTILVPGLRDARHRAA